MWRCAEDSRSGELSPALRAEQMAMHERVRASQQHRRFKQSDYDVLPHRLILMRHAESQGNVDMNTYQSTPDHMVSLTDKGRRQAIASGIAVRQRLQTCHPGDRFQVFFMTSPYSRTLETTDMVLNAFEDHEVSGVRSVVQLREQDFGNFQDPQRIKHDLSERLRFGRFWFRFPNGESGADVLDRLSIFEDHLTRDMLMGRYADQSLCLVTHGLTMRILLMKWFHWTVEEFLEVYNPANCEPIVLEKLPWEQIVEMQGDRWIHVKQAYGLCPESISKLQNCTPRMASYLGRKTGKRLSPKAEWQASRGHVATNSDDDEALEYLASTLSSWEEVDEEQLQRAKEQLISSDEEHWFVTVDEGDFWHGGDTHGMRIDDN